MLSPEELFAVRSREQSLPQRSHGQKDFLEDGSALQSDKLRVCRSEQWELLGEERVERMGSLVKGVWKPKEGLVELTTPAGKFWQTMGCTERGTQCLLPEEAVYLLECGSVQLFYRDMPLSVQEAYERLLTHGTFSVLQYRVYSHLKRLGYIVTRFDPSLVPSLYERRLNLESCNKPHRKRKRSSSPRQKNNIQQEKKKEGNEQTDTTSKTTYPDCSGQQEHQSTISTQSDGQSEQKLVGDLSERMLCPTVNQSKSLLLQDPNQPEQSNQSRSSRWDFSKISFPNCAADRPFILLPVPDQELLPENVAGREVDVSCWLLKLNLRPEKFSRREQEQLNWERRYKRSVNADPGVQRCSNWKEYKQHLRDREQQQEQERPPHLWASSVTPLVSPGRDKTTASVLEQITVTSPSSLLVGAERLQSSDLDTPQIHFNVYQADGSTEFKKSKPGAPYTRISVCSFDEKVPSLRTVKTLAYQSGDVPVVFAVVEPGELAFYTIKDFQLPVDVYP
ncbi:tRNA-splicing endonuclease subunit Sen54 [Discoglossus pictus]